MPSTQWISAVGRDVAIVAGCGALGAVARYFASGWAHLLLGRHFAWGTLLVNLVGCFLLGLLAHVAEETRLLHPAARAGLAVGFLGAFTTYSTFGLETFRYLEANNFAAAGTNVAANLVLGLAAVWAGLTLARMAF